ncbi:DUF4352 domain-containing protein [Gordonia sp. CPCC 205515]|uniref:DUF4352 domain-containing protein n=1 Tax=Gordonia sp. CPCC 205515 TaxID=3140791 RepID=UPI003AF3E1A9
MTNTHETGPVDPAAPQYPTAPQGAAPYGQQPYPPAPYPTGPYAQQPYGQMPPAPPAPPAKKKRKWPWIVGGIVVLLIIISALSGGGSDDKSDNASSSSGGDTATAANAPAAPADDAAPAGLNTPVRDGKFEFVVTGVQPGLDTVGDNPYLTEKAQGQFVIVSMTVKNIGDKPQGFSPTSQKLFDDQGRSFETDTSAQIALDETDIAVWDNINPGNTVQVKLVYDMPADAQPTKIELHDSMFSGGADVALK